MAYKPAQLASLNRSAVSPFSVPWVQLGFAFLGLTLALPQYLETGIWLMSPSLFMGVLLGWHGWRRLTWQKLWRNYFVLAGAFLFWMLISSYYSADLDSLWITFTLGIWLILIIPGLATLLRVSRFRSALLVGILSGTTVYLIVVLFRMVSGEPVLDSSEFTSSLLGRNRNAVNIGVVMILPFLLSTRTTINVIAILKWTLLSLTFLWLLSSGGRAGLLGGVFTLIFFSLVQHRFSNKLRTLIMLSLVATLLATTLIKTEALTPQAISRIQNMVNKPNETANRDARNILFKKAWYIGLENPITGIGMGNFRGQYHPIVEEATTVKMRSVALNYQAHNTYLEILSETGFPGVIFLIGMILVVLRTAIGKTSNRDVRLGLCMVAGVLFQIFWHTSLSAFLWYSMAILLGATLEYDDKETEKRLAQHAEL